MVIPSDFLERLLPQLDNTGLSVCCCTNGSKSGISQQDSFYLKKILEVRSSRKGAERRSKSHLERSSRRGRRFQDVIAWDKDVDNRFRSAGYKVKLDTSVTALQRRMTFRRSFAYRAQAGRARKELGVSLGRTILHSILRLRLFVLYGYLKEPTQSTPTDSRDRK